MLEKKPETDCSDTGGDMNLSIASATFFAAILLTGAAQAAHPWFESPPGLPCQESAHSPADVIQTFRKVYGPSADITTAERKGSDGTLTVDVIHDGRGVTLWSTQEACIADNAGPDKIPDKYR